MTCVLISRMFCRSGLVLFWKGRSRNVSFERNICRLRGSGRPVVLQNRWFCMNMNHWRTNGGEQTWRTLRTTVWVNHPNSVLRQVRFCCRYLTSGLCLDFLRERFKSGPNIELVKDLRAFFMIQTLKRGSGSLLGRDKTFSLVLHVLWWF